MPEITFMPVQGSIEVREYDEVTVDVCGWVRAKDGEDEKWFPPHRVAKVRFDSD